MAETSSPERERAFEADERFALPDLTAIEGVAAVGSPAEGEFEVVFYDAPDLRLLRADVTLRRQDAGADPGWYVRLPSADHSGRALHHPLGRATKVPPKAVVEPVRGLLRGAAAGPVATVRGRRTAIPLLGDDGTALGAVTDADLHGTTRAAADGEAAVLGRWRELRVALAVDDERLLAELGAALVVAGAHSVPSAADPGRMLSERLMGDGGPGQEPEPGAVRRGRATKKNRRTPTAGHVVLDALRAQLDALQQADLMVRTDTPDGVHQVRVACRRLRSILAAYRPVLDREQTEPIRQELRWLGAEFGAARDKEVAYDHLRDLVHAQPPELVLGPVAARLQQRALVEDKGEQARARRALGGARYFRLLDTLDALVADPPFTPKADRPADRVLHAVVRKTTTRLRRRVRTADDERATEAHDVALHEVRKAGKRVRYAAEVAVPVLGPRQSRLVDAMKDMQDLLGARQDTVHTRAFCREEGVRAFAAGENAWTYGLLHALEQARATQAERDFWDAWPGLRPVLRKVVKR